MSSPIQPAYLPAQVSILSKSQLSQNLIELRFGGEIDWLATNGLDQRIKLLIPSRKEHTSITTYGSGDDWYENWRNLSEDLRAPIRTYTITKPNSSAGEFSVIFALHEPAGVVGKWLEQTEVGDQLIVVIPNARSEHSTAGIEWKPLGAKQLVLVGDETALPAIWNIDGSLEGKSGTAFIEVGHESDTKALGFENLEVHWSIRGQNEYGQKLLAEFSRFVGAEISAHVVTGAEDELLWETSAIPGESYWWVAAESSLVRSVRRQLVAAGIAKSDIAFMGYWRAGKSET